VTQSLGTNVLVQLLRIDLFPELACNLVVLVLEIRVRIFQGFEYEKRHHQVDGGEDTRGVKECLPCGHQRRQRMLPFSASGREMSP
jgi:hypothetical protein